MGAGAKKMKNARIIRSNADKKGNSGVEITYIRVWKEMVPERFKEENYECIRAIV